MCSTAIDAFRVLTVYLKPVLPALAAQVEAFLNIAGRWTGKAPAGCPLGHAIQHLPAPDDPHRAKQIDALPQANRESRADRRRAGEGGQTRAGCRRARRPLPRSNATPRSSSIRHRPRRPHPHISIDDFTKVELRAAKIVTPGHVEGADKLIRLVARHRRDRRSRNPKPRQVFAGIKSAYDPATLIGRITVMVANLAPRKMKFGHERRHDARRIGRRRQHAGIFLLSPDAGALPGMKVK